MLQISSAWPSGKRLNFKNTFPAAQRSNLNKSISGYQSENATKKGEKYEVFNFACFWIVFVCQKLDWINTFFTFDCLVSFLFSKRPPNPPWLRRCPRGLKYEHMLYANLMCVWGNFHCENYPRIRPEPSWEDHYAIYIPAKSCSKKGNAFGYQTCSFFFLLSATHLQFTIYSNNNIYSLFIFLDHLFICWS